MDVLGRLCYNSLSKFGYLSHRVWEKFKESINRACCDLYLGFAMLKGILRKYFCAESNQKYQNQYGFSSYFLKFPSGARIELMSL